MSSHPRTQIGSLLKAAPDPTQHRRPKPPACTSAPSAARANPPTPPTPDPAVAWPPCAAARSTRQATTRARRTLAIQAVAACDGGCNHMRWRLRPHVMEATTTCDGGCNHMGQARRTSPARWRRPTARPCLSSLESPLGWCHSARSRTDPGILGRTAQAPQAAGLRYALGTSRRAAQGPMGGCGTAEGLPALDFRFCGSQHSDAARQQQQRRRRGGQGPV